jgi:hypothetical protein
MIKNIYSISEIEYFPAIVFRVKQIKNGKNVLDCEIGIRGRLTGGLYTHPSLKFPIMHHTDISPFLCFFTLNRIKRAFNCFGFCFQNTALQVGVENVRF